MLSLLCLLPALAAPLATTGESVAGLTVLDVTEHPEYQRVDVKLADGRTLSLEVTATPEPTGACTHHGLSLSPRWELLGESIELEDQPPVVLAFCERLAAQGEPLALRPPSGGEQEVKSEPDPEPSIATPPTQQAPRHWLHLPLLALLASLAAALLGPIRRGIATLPATARRDLGLVTAAGLLARLALSPWTVVWGPFFGYGRLTEAWGSNGAHPLYGGGFSAIMGPLSAAFGDAPEVLFGTNLALSILCVPMLWALARMLAGEDDRITPMVAALGLALLPSAVWLSATEVMHVQVAALELLSITAAVGFTRTSSPALALASALSIGVAAHIRPEVAPMALLPAGWVLLNARPAAIRWVVVAALVIVGLVGHRALDILFTDIKPAADYGAAATSWKFWTALFPSLWSPGSTLYTHTFAQLRLTPFVLPMLALGAVFTPKRRVALLALAWWVLTVLPVLPKSWPLVDAIRLQLPGQAPALLLAGLGAAALTRRLSVARWWTAPALVAAISVAYLPLVIRPWAAHQEFAFLQEVIPALPADAIVLYDDGDIHHAEFAAWVNVASSARWVGITRFRDQGLSAEGPLLAWRGVSCQARPHDESIPGDTVCGILQGACEIRPWKTTEVTSRSDVNKIMPDNPDPIGIFYVDSCRFRDDAP